MMQIIRLTVILLQHERIFFIMTDKELKLQIKVVATFEELQFRMDKVLSSPVDMRFYSEYLNEHYTSKRIDEMKQYLNY